MIKKPVAAAITVVLFVLTVASCWYFNFVQDEFSPWRALGIPILVLIVAFGSLIWSTNDNFYHVKSGVVINHDFNPAHRRTPTLINGIIVLGPWEPDDWGVEVRDKHGATGWFHFSQDVLSRYPIGSNYP